MFLPERDLLTIMSPETSWSELSVTVLKLQNFGPLAIALFTEIQAKVTFEDYRAKVRQLVVEVKDGLFTDDAVKHFLVFLLLPNYESLQGE